MNMAASWTFATGAKWKGRESIEISSPGKPTLDGSAPADFGGLPDRWTPEDLLVGAVESCLLLTLLYFVGKQRIRLTGYRSRATGVMEKTPNGLRFTGIQVEIDSEVETAEDEGKLRQAMAKAKQCCPVGTAVNVPVTVVLGSRIKSPSSQAA